MNERMVPWPSLSLGREQPFELAGTRVRPAALEVETGGAVTTLEPQVMKVLVALHRGYGRPVSRDELIDVAWGGRIVTEAALNRCVAWLRKALAPNPGILVETIPTVGYRLRIGDGEPREVDISRKSSGAFATVGTRTAWIGALAVTTVLAVAALIVFLQLPRPVGWMVTDYRPLTTEPGMETHPALSPGGQQLVYSQRPDSSGARDLYLRDIEQGDPIRLTAGPGDDHSAAWSPAGDRVAFVRSVPGGTCTLITMSVPAGAERIAARCQSARQTRIAWANAGTLLFSDRPNRNSNWRIRTADLASGRVADLTRPSPDALGDVDPVVSRDGRKLLFRRSLLLGSNELVLKDLDAGLERSLTNDGWRAAGYVFSSDGRHVIYSSNRGGSFGLWSIDTERSDPPERISLGAGQFTFSRLSTDRNNRLAVEAPRIRTNISAMSKSGALTPITRTSSDDWAPRGAADGAVAYISTRSGAYELWITRPDGRTVRLTNLVASYLHSPAWSPDGRSLAFVAVKDGRAGLYTVNRDGSRLRTIVVDGFDKEDPVWAASADGLIYLERRGLRSRLVRIGLAPGQKPRPIAGGGDWRALRQGPGGRLFALPRVSDDVRALDRGPAPAVKVADGDAWTVGADGVYVLTDRGGTRTALWHHPWLGPPRRVGDIVAGGDIGIGADGRILVTQAFDEQVDLGLFRLEQR